MPSHDSYQTHSYSDYIGKGNPNFKMSKTPYFVDEWTAYSEKPMLSPFVSNLKTPLEFFDFIINQSIRQQIIEHTNKNLSKYGCKPMDETEFRAYIGIMLLLGYLKKHYVSIDKIWSVQNPHHLDLPICAMPRDRFKDISSLICFDDPSTRLVRSLGRQIIPD